MHYTLAVVVLGLAALASAQVIVPGTCPDVTVQQNFEVQRYMGVWYENRKYFAMFQAGATCARAEYTLNADGSVRVQNSETRGVNVNAIEGVATIPNPAEPAKLLVNFPQQGSNLANYWVLGTDYDNYVVVWSCTQFGSATGRFAWVLTRQPSPSQAVLDAANAVLVANNIDQTPFRPTPQENCVNYRSLY